MTYLEMVNAVLRRIREDETASVTSSDVVVRLVADFVNDAKRTVEESHTWNALRHTWDISTVDGTQTYSLTGSGSHVTIDMVSNSASNCVLRNVSPTRIRYKNLLTASSGSPTEYAINGVDGSGDTRIQFYPTPSAVETIHVDGFKRQADLVGNDDVILVPAQPVFYWALALALRERGEVGGQTAAEIFMVARNYLSDAISLDTANNPTENIWFEV